MALSVFPERMNPINPEDVEASLRTLERYVQYMTERVEFALSKNFRTTTELGEAAEETAVSLEDALESLRETSETVSNLIDTVSGQGADIGGLQDNVEGISDSIGDLTDIVSGQGNDISGLQDSLAQVQTMIKSIVVTPEMFGAIGDGITNDGTAMNDMFAHLSQYGGIAFLGPKTYLTNTTISISPEAFGGNRGFSVYGCGEKTVIKRGQNAAHVFRMTYAANVALCGFHIDVNTSGVTVPTNAHAGIYCVSCSDITLERITVSGFEFCGMMHYVPKDDLEAGIVSQHIRLIDCLFDGTSNFNPSICDGTQNKYHSGCILTSVNHSAFVRCRAINCNSYALEFKGYLTADHREPIKNNAYIDCYAENCFRGGIYFGGESETTLSTLHDTATVNGFVAVNCFSDSEFGFCDKLDINGFVIEKTQGYPFNTYMLPVRFRCVTNSSIEMAYYCFNSAVVHPAIVRLAEGSKNISITLKNDNFTSVITPYASDGSCESVTFIRQAKGVPLRDVSTSSTIAGHDIYCIDVGGNNMMLGSTVLTEQELIQLKALLQ